MDRILKGLIFNNEMTVAVLSTTDLVNEAIKVHGLSPLSAAALGRTLTACAYISSNLKNNTDSMSITIKGDGVGGHITVSGNKKLQIRGLIDNPKAELPLNSLGKLDVAGCVGKGSMTVVKDLGLKTPFVGTVELVSGEIAEDFAAYFMQSEQIPSACALGVKIGKDGKALGAGGIIISALPSCSEESLEKAEKLFANFTNVRDLFETSTPQEILKTYFGDIGYYEEYPKYECTCNKQYIDKVLITLGSGELYDILEKKGKITLHCHYCNTVYEYGRGDVENLLKNPNE